MIIAGFGFRTAAHEASLRSALAHACTGVSGRVSALATAAAKVDHGALRSLAQTLDLPVYALKADTLSQTQTITHSAASMAAWQTGSVAEAAALAAAGPGAYLIATRSISDDHMATCALACRQERETN